MIREHKNFDIDAKERLLGENAVNKEIREFAKFVKDNMPSHVNSFHLDVTRDGYITNAIVKERINE